MHLRERLLGFLDAASSFLDAASSFLQFFVFVVRDDLLELLHDDRVFLPNQVQSQLPLNVQEVLA